MGRYYNTQTGRSGKFGVCIQSSMDARDFFGASESGLMDESTGEFFIGKDQKEELKGKIDELYDKLEVPKEKRVYYLQNNRFPSNTDKGVSEGEFHDLLNDYTLIIVHRNEVKRYNKRDGYEHNSWYSERAEAAGKHMTAIESREGATLCGCRLYLGLTMLSDIEDTGECWLTAEL